MHVEKTDVANLQVGDYIYSPNSGCRFYEVMKIDENDIWTREVSTYIQPYCHITDKAQVYRVTELIDYSTI